MPPLDEKYIVLAMFLALLATQAIAFERGWNHDIWVWTSNIAAAIVFYLIGGDRAKRKAAST